MYSLPERRAGSPVHSSAGPRMAKSMPARSHQLGHGLTDLLVLVVERAGAADPVEVLVARSSSPASMPPPSGVLRFDHVDTDRFLVQSVRVGLAHGPGVRRVLHGPEGGAELGREVRLHQGQVASHVEDLVEDLDVDRADLVTRLARRARPQLVGGDPIEHPVGSCTSISGSTPIGGDTAGSPVRAMTSPVFSTISRGSSGLPVAWAGQTDVQRPHMVQASVSMQLLPGEALDGGGSERLQFGRLEVGQGLHRPLRPLPTRTGTCSTVR